MNRRILVITFVVMAIGLLTPATLALDPMGPPAAGLTQGQWSLGAEYSYSEQSLWRTQGYSADFTGVEQEINKIYGKIG
ncbi:MAG: hypothetical protein JXB29_09915 [Sedimentisphaerales bacterium]|nr:hypothetical protein [Sedimentisphaerales bacterium]